MNISRLIFGAVFFIVGMLLIVLAFFTAWLVGIYGIILLILGVVIFFNKKEDKIEQRKDLNKKGNKK